MPEFYDGYGLQVVRHLGPDCRHVEHLPHGFEIRAPERQHRTGYLYLGLALILSIVRPSGTVIRHGAANRAPAPIGLDASVEVLPRDGVPVRAPVGEETPQPQV